MKKTNKEQGRQSDDLAKEIDEFYEKALTMEVDEFYEKYRRLHKKIFAQKNRKYLLEYLTSIKNYYESKLNFDLQVKLEKISPLLWIVPLAIGIASISLIGTQVYLQYRTGQAISDMITPPLSYELYSPPERILPFECTRSKFIVVNCGESPGEYEIIVRGNGILIYDDCSRKGNGKSLKQTEWTVPPDDKSPNDFTIWLDTEEYPVTINFKIKVFDLKKRIIVFEKTFVYERIDFDLSSSENGYYYSYIGDFSPG